MAAKLGKRVQDLEHRASPSGRARICWEGSEPPADLGPNDTLYVLSWLSPDEAEENPGVA